MPRQPLPRDAVSFLAVIAVAIAAQTANAQPMAGPYKEVHKLPDTPAGKRVAELLEVIDAADRERTRAFVTEQFAPPFRDMIPIEEHVSILTEVHDRSGGYDFYSVRDYEQPLPETKVIATVRSRITELWELFVVDVEPEAPHRIAGLHFAPTGPPGDLPPAPALTEARAVQELREYLDRLVRLDAFSGAVLLAKDGNVLFKQACGLASKRFNVPNRIDTKFNLGSLNKMFTGVAIVQLAERGKLSFSDPVSKYLGEDWLPSEAADQVRIEHLLTHTSGLGSYFNNKFEKSSRLRYRTVDDYKPLVKGESLAFEPGTSRRYSNTGFLLLGAIIEKVTGQSYFDYVRENIYKPAGMTNTDCYEMDRPIPNLAIGYSKERSGDEVRWVNNIFKHVVKGGPAGGGFSTVEDLLKFDQALRKHKLLSPQSTTLVWTPKPEVGSPDYGYGFGIEGSPGDRIVGHAGGFFGISANLGIHLDTGYTVVVLSNYDDAAEFVTQKVRSLLERAKPSGAKSSTTPTNVGGSSTAPTSSSESSVTPTNVGGAIR